LFPTDPITSRILICIVDANSTHRLDTARALTSFYEVAEFSEQGMALDAIAFNPPAAVIIDENVAPRGGLPLLREICCVPDLDRVPIICTATSHRTSFLGDAIGLGVRTTLIKPFRRSALLQALSKEINGKAERSWARIEPVQRAALRRTIRAFNSIADIIAEEGELPYDAVREACEPLVEAVRHGHYKDMLHGVRNHDNYTYVHSLRVAIFLSVFGHSIGIQGNDLMVLATGGLLHDLGKMAVPHSILNKMGRLTDEEMETMRGHVSNTGKFLRGAIAIPRGTLVIAEQHHEKIDGSGYPKGLKGKELNELARMASIVDIFGALTDRRVYKEAIEPEKALHIMTEMGDVLDQHLVGMFRTVLLDTAKDIA
jgi:HD-GYP domain-containing protein (c-di-GMP phosphodiesterase class II)